MLRLKDEENVFVKGIRNAQKDGKKVYILGAGLGAIRIAEGLNYQKLSFDAFVVDKNYYRRGDILLDKEILCLDEVMDSNCILIRSIANYPRLNELKENMEMIDEDVQSLYMQASDPLDREWAFNNIDKWNRVYDVLADEKSKQVLNAYLNQNLTGRFLMMKDVYDGEQRLYFGEDFYDLSKVQCIIDCGAYNGDSFLAFCDEYQRRTGMPYRGKAYLFEPDEKNRRTIEHNCRRCVADINVVQSGVWNEEGVLRFQIDDNYGNAGMVAASGEVAIRVNSIDAVVREEKVVDFIKMCVEGVELNALKGAVDTIKRDHPVLALAAYHKREDLIELSDYIKSLCVDYQFYLRAYGGPYCNGIILYAVS